MTAVVDPYLLAIPSGENITPEMVSGYVSRLAAWDKAFRTEADYVVSGAVMSEMYSLKLHPDYHNLQKLFEKYNINEYSAFDVAESCKTVIENFPQMEGRAGADGVECEKENQKIIPEQIKARLHPSIAEVFGTALISTSYALNVLEDADDWRLATAPIEDNYEEIVASGQVSDSTGIILVERHWRLLFKPSDYVDLISSEGKILKICESDPFAALKLSWTNVKKDIHSIKDIGEYNIRFNDPRFVESLRDKIIKKRPYYRKDVARVFDGIVYALTNLWKYPSDKHHHLREKIQSRTGNQQSRRQGDTTDYGGRIEICGGKTPLHVHYWRCADGSYEVSNVTDEHDDPTIFY